jgi:hypothetical protein
MRNTVLFLFTLLLQYKSFGQETCVSSTYFQKEANANLTSINGSMEVQRLINRTSNDQRISSQSIAAGPGLSVIKIPVVVHVLYNTPEQKVTEEQVRSQIEVLNRDFRKLNSVTASIPDYFKSLAADCFIEFNLATTDPRGKPTTGIIYRQTSMASFGSDDNIKFSKTGGDDAWDANKYLNIWVGKLSVGIIGYSSAPGSKKEKDGVVLRYTAFGTLGTVVPPYNMGRTAVHEVGHWLGLKHIWGDRYCGDDDVPDTPPQKGPTKGCPSSAIASCDNALTGSMYMNYMDVTYDACTGMFTIGQRDKMRSLFEPGGARYSFISSGDTTGILIPTAGALPTDTILNNNIRIFPNPANNLIIISIDYNDLIGEYITLHNSFGQQLMQGKISSVKTELNVSGLKNGLYFIKTGRKNSLQKLLIQKHR